MTPLHTLILLHLPLVLGYATSAPLSKPAFLPKLVDPTKHSAAAPSSPQHQPQRYKLGIGRNAALNKVETASEAAPSTMYSTKVTLSKKRKLKCSIPLYPKLHSQDVLEISGDCITYRQSDVLSSSPDKHLDVNTVWLEMLIYKEQQMQLAHYSQ